MYSDPNLDPQLFGQRVRSTILHRIVGHVAAEWAIAPQALIAPTRGRAKVAAARQTAMYLCHVVAGRTLTDVGLFFGRDRTTVAHACRLVEDKRDDGDFDARLNGLEREIVVATESEVA